MKKPARSHRTTHSMTDQGFVSAVMGSTWGLRGFPLIRVGTWYARGDRDAVEELISARYFGAVNDEEI